MHRLVEGPHDVDAWHTILIQEAPGQRAETVARRPVSPNAQHYETRSDGGYGPHFTDVPAQILADAVPCLRIIHVDPAL